jgi:hypothetical protein
MSVIVIKSETNEYKVLVKAGDEELARQEAVKAAISAEEARLSSIAASDSEQVATEKAAQTLEDAASALASKVDAESAATASDVSATDSQNAKELSVAAKVIAIEEAGKSFVSAGESAGSAAAAAASSALITNKAEVNITTAGNILRADGTLFKSISEVEFLRNSAAFAKSFPAMFMGFSFLENWGKTNENQSYRGDTYTIIDGFKTMPVSVLEGHINGRVTFRVAASDNSTFVQVSFMADANNYFQIEFNRRFVTISQKLNGVLTTLLQKDLTSTFGLLRNDLRTFEFDITRDNSSNNIYRINIVVKGQFITFETSSEVFQFASLNKFGIRSISSGNVDFITFT